ncbi:MAG: hypothetical protein U1E18_06190 [Brevundimonas sp.]|uniref:hypothetical protein n=1 Tax=Brevundimonas sp. TaxID=1871086 RepID=UPI002737020A|nr:hypothetical protein [Brevundimonas sp.]MDZ4109175.1 hypothetical protein [Brevundimonas sp.]
MKREERLDDHAFRTLAALAAGELGFYPILSARSTARARGEGWSTPQGSLTARGQGMLLAEQVRRARA